ncbi:MAG: FmdE family protein [Desulfatiglandaceae bacterium]|jgi:formylmethanofuran dehydrogenase subunit E
MDTAFEELIAFHGHSCPGLAIGYRMTRAGLAFLSGSRAVDEEMVAIVENNACGVDALQCLSGCTFGKGNLIFKDYGKHVFTFYDRSSGKGVRVVFRHGNVSDDLRKERAKFTDWLLSAPEEEVVTMEEVVIEEPEPARIMISAECAFCHEDVMETRTKEIKGQVVCIPCAGKYSASRKGS